MMGHIVIERLEFHARCGVTPEERGRAQPLAVDVDLQCPTDPAAASDELAHTVDYAQVAQRLVAVGSAQDCALLETLAERLLSMLLAEFPVDRVRLWVRKLAPPLKLVTGSVGVRLERSRVGQYAFAPDPAPARFLIQQLPRLPKGHALDVAAGGGRHTLYLAANGFHVDAVDRDEEALTRVASLAQLRNLPNITTRLLDFEQSDGQRVDLPREGYDLILVFFYLHRPLIPVLIDALRPNGMLLYETFTIDNYLQHKHPRRWEFCLGHNELLRLATPLRILHYDEGEHENATGAAFTAQLVAQKSVTS